MGEVFAIGAGAVKRRGREVDLHEETGLLAVPFLHPAIQHVHELPPDQLIGAGGLLTVDVVRLVVEDDQVRVFGHEIRDHFALGLLPG